MSVKSSIEFAGIERVIIGDPIPVSRQDLHRELVVARERLRFARQEVRRLEKKLKDLEHLGHTEADHSMPSVPPGTIHTSDHGV